MDINKLAKQIEKHLQNEADEWSVAVNNGDIYCYYTDILRFTISPDDEFLIDDTFYISGNDLDLEMLCDIKKVIDTSIEKDIVDNLVKFTQSNNEDMER